MAFSNGTGLVGNALGLTGILISALLVVSQHMSTRITCDIVGFFYLEDGENTPEVHSSSQ